MGKKEDLQNQIRDLDNQINNATDDNERNRLTKQRDDLQRQAQNL